MNRIQIDIAEVYDDGGKPLRAACIGQAEVDENRQAQGFGPVAVIAVYPSTEPCTGICFSYHGKHMHTFTSVDTADQVLDTMRHVQSNQIACNVVVEKLLRLFDELTPPLRLMCEVIIPSEKELN